MWFLLSCTPQVEPLNKGTPWYTAAIPYSEVVPYLGGLCLLSFYAFLQHPLWNGGIRVLCFEQLEATSFKSKLVVWAESRQLQFSRKVCTSSNACFKLFIWGEWGEYQVHHRNCSVPQWTSDPTSCAKPSMRFTSHRSTHTWRLSSALTYWSNEQDYRGPIAVEMSDPSDNVSSTSRKGSSELTSVVVVLNSSLFWSTSL